MRLLLDTHILLWAAGAPDRLSERARAMLEAGENTLVFSVASLWEISIKAGLGRDDFRVDGAALRRGLLEHGYEELPISGIHALMVRDLPPVHRDPFDRMLVAQARQEALVLVTSDTLLLHYPGNIELV